MGYHQPRKDAGDATCAANTTAAAESASDFLNGSAPLRRQRLLQLPRNSFELCRNRRVPIFPHDRHPAVSRLARRYVDRNLTQQRNAQTFRFALTTAASENIVAFPVTRRAEVT